MHDPENDEPEDPEEAACQLLEAFGDDEERTSSLERGEPKFSQIREAVDNSTPITRLLAGERDRAERRLARAAKHLEKAERKGDQESIDAAERTYQAAAEAWMEIQNDEPEEDTGPMTLSQALRWDRNRELDAMEQKARIDALEVFLAYVFADGLADPWKAFKRLVAITRRVRPIYLNAMTQTEIGIVLKETKAAPSAREKKVVEGLMRRFKMLGFHLLGGTKSDTTRRRCSEAQKNNTNRRGGRRKRATK